MGRAQKAKGSAYENKLVAFLEAEGYAGSYRVPLSGALGHNTQVASKLPPELVTALSGDVACRVKPGVYLPIEVKYRQDAAGFSQLYNDMELGGFSLRSYDDCLIFPESEVQDMIAHLQGAELGHSGIQMNRPAIGKILAGFFTNQEILALKAHKRPWLFVVRHQDIPFLKEGMNATRP